jgi:hypothetical protein
MAGLVPAIHVFILQWSQDVDARHKAGHDDFHHKAPLKLAAFRIRLSGCPGNRRIFIVAKATSVWELPANDGVATEQFNCQAVRGVDECLCAPAGQG